MGLPDAYDCRASLSLQLYSLRAERPTVQACDRPSISCGAIHAERRSTFIAANYSTEKTNAEPKKDRRCPVALKLEPTRWADSDANTWHQGGFAPMATQTLRTFDALAGGL